MPIVQPSQHECNKMEPGDIIFVTHRNFLYKMYRKYFKQGLTKLKIKENWNEPIKYIEYYQEDCTLIFNYEINCIQSLDNQISYIISLGPKRKGFKVGCFKSVLVGLTNIQLIFDNNITITLPTYPIKQAISLNDYKLNKIIDSRKIQQAIKFRRYKGDYFKKYAKQHNIEHYNAQYCSICGKPLIFHFLEDTIHLENTCVCGYNKTDLKEMSYDEMSLWYYGFNNQYAENYVKTFWFKEGGLGEQ